MAASVDNPKVKGYISVAGAGRPAYEIIEEQMAGQPEVIRNMVRSINTSLKEGKLVPDVPIGLQALFRSSVQPYMISWYTYNPQEIIKKLKVPVLILQGDKDMQVSVKRRRTIEAIPTFGRLPFDREYEPSDEDLRYDGSAKTDGYLYRSGPSVA